MPHLIFLCGHAGTGKTTLAKRLVRELNDRSEDSYCMLDKDTLYGNFSSAVMGVLTGNPNDRDSPVYLDNLRNPEYAGLLDTARDNLELGTHVLVVAPLSREIKAHQLIDRDWLRVGPEVQITVVWVHLQEAEARRRIELRGNPNDEWKLQHWDQYRTRLFQPNPDEYPELFQFDNTQDDGTRYRELLEMLLLVEQQGRTS
ncbi:ATP-binding protein [Brachymonas sp. G13]|uniref:AAA family ATPase n=1 Tax=Brachymonas wangyanguii TaxID=3130163 RepID=UPI0016BC0157|nr:ATP-binding protein [Ramlibacter sp.]